MFGKSPLRAIKLFCLWIILPLAAFGLLLTLAPSPTLNALSIGITHTRTDGVAYGPLPRHRLDIYRPSSAAPIGGWPVAVFFYGGSWNRGERADYRFVGEALASRGVLTLVADYRLYPEVRYPDFLSDCALALAYGLHDAARLGGNPRRVFVMGHSAGAYNAAMLALDARWLQATGHSPTELAGWVGLAGPYDFLPIKNPDVKPVFFHPNYPTGTQTIAYVGRDSLRGFLGAAASDDLINPQRNTLGLAQRLRDAGASVRVKMYERVNHMTLIGTFARPLRWLAPVLDDVVGFVNDSTRSP